MQQVRYIAREKGLNIAKQNKVELIRHVQLEEGNLACFATDVDATCPRYQCMWREDCFHCSLKTRS